SFLYSLSFYSYCRPKMSARDWDSRSDDDEDDDGDGELQSSDWLTPPLSAGSRRTPSPAKNLHITTLADSPSATSSDSPTSSVQSPPTPLPHTPLFSPQNSVEKEELTPELAQAGWRRCWSEREK